MNQALRHLLDTHNGVIAWREACALLPPHVVRYASRSGQLRLIFPGVLTDASTLDVHGRYRAALLCAGSDSALSHTSALDVWGLAPTEQDTPIHVTTPPDRRIRVSGIVGHRRDGFARQMPHVVWRSGLPLTRLERSVVDSWPLLAADVRRAPAIQAVADRMTTAERLATALAEAPSLPGRAELAHLVALLAAGCHSPLELWGHEHVFTGPGFERLRWQVPIRIDNRTVLLDTFDEESATNFELDGARWHNSARDRERDQRRDARLATIGIHAVRFSRQRLTYEVRQVRAESLAIMAARRARRLIQIG
jgi:very-short-patch-repair endonuclease